MVDQFTEIAFMCPDCQAIIGGGEYDEETLLAIEAHAAASGLMMLRMWTDPRLQQERCSFLHLATVGAALYACFDIGKAEWLKIKCPYGLPGDSLWFREPFRCSEEPLPYDPDDPGVCLVPVIHYEDGTHDYIDVVEFARWECSLFSKGFRALGNHPHHIFMPRFLSRASREIAEIRVERLHDIKEAGAIAEGCIKQEWPPNGRWMQAFGQEPPSSPLEQFRTLWEQINGTGSWDLNNWVWVIEFRRLEQ